ncbi:MAG: bifunctional glycosyltransferase/class I SAM-dependent methyltransferase [Candidatus Moraniibacteriota bacterium]
MKEILPNRATEKARIVFSQQKVALFIVTYNAESQIEKTIRRIPEWCRPLFAEIFVIDDSSTDRTVARAIGTGQMLGLKNFSVMKTPTNQGYGGNQKIGYSYAIQQGYDIVILLHGDGQYPPEYLPDIVADYADSAVGAVFGSRMINRADALRGGMPLYKWFGNQILTRIENAILGTALSEFHSGYRSYRTNMLAKVPYQLNSDGFHFDTDIIIQLDLIGAQIIEIPMPTHYGDEECRVDGMKYAWNCIKSSVKSRLHQAGLFFQPNYEFPNNISRTYQMKSADTSLHAYVLRQPWKSGMHIADLGANDCELAQRIAERGTIVTAVDTALPIETLGIRSFQLDLNEDFPEKIGQDAYNAVIALDVIEHLYPPERATERIYRILKPDGLLFASTANISYVVMRITHLLGWFNYGKKGILDRTHHRLFTIHSFRRLLENSGFRVIRIRGFGPPIRDAFGNGMLWTTLDRVSAFLAEMYPALFAFNFLIIARKTPTTEERMLSTLASKQS